MLVRLVATTTTALVVLVVLFAAATAALLGSELALPGFPHPATGPDSGAPASPAALGDIPPDMLTLYRSGATTCPGLSWSVLAAIGKIESDHDRSTLPGVHSGANPAGARGPMQFEPDTFAHYANPVPAGGVSPASPYDPIDAVFAAARMLCADGAAQPSRLPAAIFAYNHSNAYVAQILTQARRYNTPDDATTSTNPDNPAPTETDSGDTAASGSPAAAVAVNFARAHIGKPYVWGGNGHVGFDCSGLTHAAYTAAGITLPRTAQTQANTGPLLPADTPIIAGDLLFYGTGLTHITHVGIAINPTHMIDAPDIGTTVRIDPIGHPIAHSRPAGR